jgi:hypothetical protein
MEGFTGGFLDALTTSTRRKILPGVTDLVFRNDPTLAYIRRNNLEQFDGGQLIQENFLYGVLPNGGPYAQGATAVMNIVQVETGATFFPKTYWVPITISKEQIQIFNKGPQAVFRLIDSRLQTAGLTMAAWLAIALYNNGQDATRTLHINGFAEQLNDGTTNSWNGNTYALYGTLSRNGTIGSALNSPMTNPAANVGGPITYKILEEMYNTCVIGDEYPNLMTTTNLGLSYIKEKFQPQWRTETQDPNIGFNGLKFNAAMVMQSQYCPGQVVPEQSASLGWVTPSSGETLFFLNTKYLRLYVSNDPEYAFGFTGFKPQFDGTLVGGQYLFAGNTTNQAPRLMRSAYGITG